MTAFKYYLGLDMGTNSVGWAATDPEYRLLKAKGKDLWGIREFNEASDLMEPFRPIVDNLVKTMHPDKFEHDEKVEILKMLQKEMIIAGRKECVNNAMKIYCRSIFDALNEGDISLIKFYKDEL